MSWTWLKFLRSLVFSRAHSVIPPAFLGPSQSMAEPSSFFPPGKNLMLGYPLTPNLPADPLFSVASTLATLTCPFKLVASSAYSGAKVLQWPHQGAQNSTNQGDSSPQTFASKVSSVRTITSFSSKSPLPPDPPELEPPWLLEPPPPSLQLATFLSFLNMKSTIPSAVLGPSQSVILPLEKNLMVGQPWICTSVLSLSPSMAAMLAMPWRALAAFSYSGAKLRQCPHQGAQNQTSQTPFLTCWKSPTVRDLTAELWSQKQSPAAMRSSTSTSCLMSIHTYIITPVQIKGRLYYGGYWGENRDFVNNLFEGQLQINQLMKYCSIYYRATGGWAASRGCQGCSYSIGWSSYPPSTRSSKRFSSRCDRSSYIRKCSQSSLRVGQGPLDGWVGGASECEQCSCSISAWSCPLCPKMEWNLSSCSWWAWAILVRLCSWGREGVGEGGMESMRMEAEERKSIWWSCLESSSGRGWALFRQGLWILYSSRLRSILSRIRQLVLGLHRLSQR